VRVTDSDALIESTFVEFDPGDPYQDRLRRRELGCAAQAPPGGKIRGGADRADRVRCESAATQRRLPATNLLAAAADFVHASERRQRSDVNEMPAMCCMSRRSLDDFLLGRLALVPTRSNRIGTFVDRTASHLDDVSIRSTPRVRRRHRLRL